MIAIKKVAHDVLHKPHQLPGLTSLSACQLFFLSLSLLILSTCSLIFPLAITLSILAPISMSGPFCCLVEEETTCLPLDIEPGKPRQLTMYNGYLTSNYGTILTSSMIVQT